MTLCRQVCYYDIIIILLLLLLCHNNIPENLRSYVRLTGAAFYPNRNVSPVRYELSFYVPEDDILHRLCREDLKSYIALTGWTL
jgi:hypothetical protein